jgi:hypothetical protein
MPGRPPRPYDPEIGAEIVRRIRALEPLSELWCDPTLPGRYTLKRWRDEVPEFSRAVRAAVNAARSEVWKFCSPYGAAIREAICDRVAEGESLKSVLRSPGMPGSWAVGRWLNAEPDFRRGMAAAREIALWVQVEAGPGGMDGRVHGQKHTFERIRWEEEQRARAAAASPAPAGEGDHTPRRAAP